MPVQRIPRYNLLLQELKKYTHTESAALDECLEKVMEICYIVNDCMFF